MNCKFCQQKCTIEHYDAIYPKEVNVWKCGNHPILVKHYVDKVYDNQYGTTYLWIDTILFWSHNDQHFRAHFLSNTFYVEKIVDITDYGTIRHETVFSLLYHPDINPENIKDKVKLYLTFS